MKVSIEKIKKWQDEQVIIQCHRVTDEVNSIVGFIRLAEGALLGYRDESITQLSLHDIFYIEAVENRVFAYTESEVFELKTRLYEFESAYAQYRFFRCSKSMVVNLMKIDSVSPLFNSRLSAKLFNGEEIVISRQYVPELKQVLSGGAA